MRILHLFKTYYPDSTGGIEQVIFQLCQGGGLGTKHEVLTLSPRPDPIELRIGAHRVVRARENLNIASTGLSLDVFARYREMAAQADIVHFHFPWPMMDVVHFATGMNRPTLVSYHSDVVKQRWLLQLYKPLMHKFLNSVDHIHVASTNYLESSPYLQSYRDKITVIPYGLDETSYPSVSETRRQYWNRILPERFFLFVGALRYYKGLEFLLEAMKKFDYPVVILGSGPQEQQLRAQAERLQLRNLHLVGHRDDEDKSCLLEMCYAFVFPSHLRSEAFGMSLLEAAMHGKPMISCEIGTGTTFANIHELTGIAVPPADPAALGNAMQRLWQQPELAKRMGASARQHFEQLFTSERMCTAMSQLYQKLLQSPSAQRDAN